MSLLARFAFSLGVLSAVAFAGRATSVYANAEGEPENEMIEELVQAGDDPILETQETLRRATPTPTPTPTPATPTPPLVPTPPPTPTPKPTPYYPTTNPWASPSLPAVAPKNPIIWGTYNRGCAIGLRPIAITNKYWEIVNDSRNRYYAHPDLWKVFERVAAWSVDQARLGKLVAGDFAQPAGGPMTDGHNSHQIGLDGDIRFKFFPADKTMSPRQKKGFAETDVADYYVAKSGGEARLVARLTNSWRDDYGKVLEQFASDPKIERIFVSPPIKRRMCELYGVPVPTPTPKATPTPAPLKPGETPTPTPPPTPEPPVKKNYPSWLKKLRPILGHTAHFHIRVSCPKGMRTCESQGEVGIENADKSGVECEGPRYEYWLETDWKKPGFLREWVMENMPPPKPTPTPTPSPTPTPEPGKPLPSPSPTPKIKPSPTPKKPKMPDIEEVIRFDDHQGHVAEPRIFGAAMALPEDGDAVSKTPTPTPTPKPAPTPVPPRWKTVTHNLPKECKKLIHWGEPPPPLSTPTPTPSPTPFPAPSPIKPKSEDSSEEMN